MVVGARAEPASERSSDEMLGGDAALLFGVGGKQRRSSRARGPAQLDRLAAQAFAGCCGLLALRLGWKLAQAAASKLCGEPRGQHGGFPPGSITSCDSSVAGDDEEEAAADDDDVADAHVDVAAGGGSLAADDDGDALADDACSAGCEPPAAASAREQWVLCAAPAPPLPEGAVLVAREHLPVSPFRFFEQFLSNEVQCLQDHHRSTGQANFTATPWRPDAAPNSPAGRFARTFEFVQPKRGVCSANARCVQQQQFSAHPGGVFVLTTLTRVHGVPYCDCFRVVSHWRAEPDAGGLAGANVEVHVAVPFLRRCLMRGLIASTTLKDSAAFFGDFLAKVQNSIATELLPLAAAEASAACSSISSGGGGVGAAGVGAAAEALLLASPPPRPPSAAAAAAGQPRRRQRAGAATSAFAGADGEVFVSANGQQQQQQQGLLSQRRHSLSPPPAAGARQQQHRHGHHGAGSSSSGGGSGGGRQRLQRAPSRPLSRRSSQQQQQQRQQHLGAPRSPSPSASASAALSHAVSAKPSFGHTMDELRLPSRAARSQQAVLTGVQMALVVLVLLLQLLLLWDYLQLRRALASASSSSSSLLAGGAYGGARGGGGGGGGPDAAAAGAFAIDALAAMAAAASPLAPLVPVPPQAPAGVFAPPAATGL